MNTMRFDTHRYVKRLQAAGFTEAQAEVQAETLADFLDESLATRRDLLPLQHELGGVKQDLTAFREEVVALEERLTYKLTVRLGSMIVVAVGMVTALVRIG